MRDADYIDVSDDITEIYSFDVENEDDRKLVYIIDRSKNQIEFLTPENYNISSILLKGFDWLPREFSENGYIKGPLMYYLNKIIENNNIIELIISKKDKNSLRKIKYGKKLILNYKDFRKLKNDLSKINSEEKLNRSLCVSDFFYELFPRVFNKVKLSSKRKAQRMLFNLQPDIIEFLKREDIETFLDFFETLLKTKYKSEIYKRELFKSTKIKIDKLAIEDIIKEFKKLIKSDPPEDKWGSFLKQNLFLIDSKYIHVLAQLNVTLANARKADFGLIDSQGYLDIFEIKKPSSKLISKKQDRGNYYWSSEAIKAIMQAEKYLYNAERMASNLAENIREQRGQVVKVIKPRSYVIMGNHKEFDNENKENDFRILRMSLKNIEVILYDELLDRIKNQKEKIYID